MRGQKCMESYGQGLDLYIFLDCGYFGPDPKPNSPYSSDLSYQSTAHKKDINIQHIYVFFMDSSGHNCMEVWGQDLDRNNHNRGKYIDPDPNPNPPYSYDLSCQCNTHKKDINVQLHSTSRTFVKT